MSLWREIQETCVGTGERASATPVREGRVETTTATAPEELNCKEYLGIRALGNGYSDYALLILGSKLKINLQFYKYYQLL